MSLTLNQLNGIMNGFAKQNRIFENEAQFQFRLAREIEKLSTQYEVYLELKTMKICKSGKDKNFYTDIMVYDTKQKDWTAIELKYKTEKSTYQISNLTIYLSSHGATDLGRFDYLFDIFRIEQLLQNPNYINNLKTDPSDEIIFQNKLNVKNGFAIFLTNDSCYWKVSKEIAEKRNAGKGCLYQEFCFTDSDKIPKNQAVKWNVKGKSCISGTFRELDLKFNSSYTFKWERYKSVSGQPEFKYLITEIV